MSFESTNLASLKKIMIISGSIIVISMLLPTANRNDSMKVSQQVHFTNLFAPIRRTENGNLMHRTLTPAIPNPPIVLWNMVNIKKIYHTEQHNKSSNIGWKRCRRFKKMSGAFTMFTVCSNSTNSSNCMIVAVLLLPL